VAVLVGIRITPVSATLNVDGQATFTLNGTYDDGTTAAITTGITWTISSGAVASLSAAGGGPFGGGGVTVTGRGAGSATLTATYTSAGTTYTDTSAITVNAPPTQTGLYIEPPTATVRVNGTQQFRAYATYSNGTSSDVTGAASWTTSDGTLATVTNAGGGGRGAVFGAGGLATGLKAAASVTITATYGTYSATATLTVTAPKPTSLVVTPAAATIKLNATQNFQAFLIYDDGTSQDVTSTATWTSSDANVAVLSVAGGGRGGGPGPGGGLVGGGTATGIGIGSATVTAQYTTDTGTILSDTATLTVTDPPILSLELTPTTPTVYLTSPNLQFTATVIYTDYTTRNVTATATWSSSAPTIAVIGASGGTAGRATGLAVGTSTITASYSGFPASTLLTVEERKVTSLQVTPTNPTTYLGLNQAFVATALYDNGTTGTVTGAATWTTSDDTVATVGVSGGSAGQATPIKAGTTTIKATYQGVSGTSVLTVSSATLSSIAITPSPLNVAVGGRQQLTATGTFSDTQTRDITNNVTWLSSSDAVATVSNANPRGLLTGVTAGTVTVEARFQDKVGTLSATIGGTAPSVDAGATTD
jgi:hypothetical protein